MRLLLVLCSMLAACTQTVAIADPSLQQIPSGPEPQSLQWNADAATMKQDLLLTARARLGEAMTRRALAADAYILAKSYAGMRPPPPADAGPNWRYPDAPFTLLLHEHGRWLVATASGVRPASTEATTEIRRLLSEPAFWRQPQAAGPGCTDAGASLLMIRYAGRRETILRGTCGETELTQRLALLTHTA